MTKTRAQSRQPAQRGAVRRVAPDAPTSRDDRPRRGLSPRTANGATVPFPGPRGQRANPDSSFRALSRRQRPRNRRTTGHSLFSLSDRNPEEVRWFETTPTPYKRPPEPVVIRGRSIGTPRGRPAPSPSAAFRSRCSSWDGKAGEGGSQSPLHPALTSTCQTQATLRRVLEGPESQFAALPQTKVQISMTHFRRFCATKALHITASLPPGRREVTEHRIPHRDAIQASLPPGRREVTP